jgi:hypothetical protein
MYQVERLGIEDRAKLERSTPVVFERAPRRDGYQSCGRQHRRRPCCSFNRPLLVRNRPSSEKVGMFRNVYQYRIKQKTITYCIRQVIRLDLSRAQEV